MTVGDRIKKLREDKQLTQEELAKAVNTTKQTIYKYENNIITNIPSDKIEKIAKVFDVSPAELMGWKYATPALKVVKKIEFEKFLNSIGYRIIYDDPEHKPFLLNQDNVCFALENNDLKKIMHSTEAFIGYTVNELIKNKKIVNNPIKKEKEHLTLKAAHEIEGASEEDKQHDYDLMDDDNF